MTAMAERTATAEALTARAAELCDVALRDMYADPFWDARFGERGRRFAREDAHFHVIYLAEAVRAGSAASFVMYVRWLQNVLTTRGMCSLHLRDMLEAIGTGIRAIGIEDVETALAYLGAGVGALRHDGDAGRIEQLAPRDEADRLAEHLVSYLGDAVALSLPRVFVDHVEWLRENGRRVGATSVRVEQALADVLAALAAAEPSIPAAAAVVATLPTTA